MTLTAAQIRKARALLGWTSPTLAKRARVGFDKALKAQDDEGISALSGLDLQDIRNAFEQAGIVFEASDRSARLPKAEHDGEL